MKKQLLILLAASLTLLSFTSDKPAYLLYDSDGKKVKYSKMLKALEEADIIFFGELHTDPIAHWMQFELTKELFSAKLDALVLGAEMFEADNQLILNEYLDGLYQASKYEAEMRLWNNYETDDKPVVEFAKTHQIPFIATNIPRRYASMVHKGGFEALDKLSPEAKSYIAPLPILYDPEVKCYKDMLDMGAPPSKEAPSMKEAPKEAPTMEEAPSMKEAPAMEEAPSMKEAPKEAPTMEEAPSMKEAPAMVEVPKEMAAETKEMAASHDKSMPAFNMENLPKAQAAKDATMAHFIMENWSEGKCMFHFNGSYHSNNHEGIVWHLKKQNADLKIVTINTVLQEEIDALSDENLNSADYIICVPESMTRTGR